MRAAKLKMFKRLLLRAWKSNEAISVALSTIIISASILAITAIATFVSTNVLELQVQSTEFEEAKMTMILLDDIIEDVGLKQGSGGYLRFNCRSGGLMIAQNNTLKVFVKGNPNPILNITSLIYLAYRGGRLVGYTPTVLRGNNIPYVTTIALPLCYLRIETGPGAWIRLDYNRVRIVDMGQNVVKGQVYNFVDITFIQLTRGEYRGSGSLSIKSQNIGIETWQRVYDNSNVTIQIQLDQGPLAEHPVSYAGGKTVVTVTVAHVSISTV